MHHSLSNNSKLSSTHSNLRTQSSHKNNIKMELTTIMHYSPGTKSRTGRILRSSTLKDGILTGKNQDQSKQVNNTSRKTVTFLRQENYWEKWTTLTKQKNATLKANGCHGVYKLTFPLDTRNTSGKKLIHLQQLQYLRHPRTGQSQTLWLTSPLITGKRTPASLWDHLDAAKQSGQNETLLNLL